jgi:hypothetical protein
MLLTQFVTVNPLNPGIFSDRSEKLLYVEASTWYKVSTLLEYLGKNKKNSTSRTTKKSNYSEYYYLEYLK